MLAYSSEAFVPSVLLLLSIILLATSVAFLIFKKCTVSMAEMLSRTYETGDRKRVEEELEQKSRAIEASMDGIALVNQRGCFSFVNQAFASIHSYDHPSELIGMHWNILYDVAERRRLERHLIGGLKYGGHIRIESVGLRKNGTTYPQEVSLTALADGGFVCVVCDITRRKRAEQDLIDSKKFLRRVIDTDPNFVFVKDAQGRFTLVNQAVADAYGVSVEAIVGKTDADFNSDVEEVRHFQNDDHYVIKNRTELIIPEEKITDANNETRWLHTVKRPLESLNGDIHVLGVATDITERKLLQDQLIHSQKMDAIGQLAGGIAHDFNNMMTGILGYTTLLKMVSERNPEAYKNADLIERAATRATELTQKLLGFARRGKHQNVPINLHNTIKETVALLARTFEKDISIRLTLDAENPFVMGDPVQVQQVILNLALNARDAMRVEIGGTPGGILTIHSTLIKEPTPFLRVMVSDTGCGIRAEDQKRIFEPFYTTKGEGRGTGMGLAMVYGITENHGGYIMVRSSPGKGSCFTIGLPSVQPPLTTIVEKITNDPTSGRGQILVVDDHQVVRDVTSEMLVTLGYKVVTARDGVEAVEYYKENYCEIDLVLIDLIMPRMGAKECLVEIKKINPNVKAILSTGYVNNHLVQELLNEGILGFVQKPYQLNRLSEVVAGALRH